MHRDDANMFSKLASAFARAYRAQLFAAALWAVLAGIFFLADRPWLGLFQSLLFCFQLSLALRYRRMTEQANANFERFAYQCPKCKSDMEEGFLLENGHYSSSSSEKSFLGSVEGSVTHHVQTYRCVGCGYLESYTR